MTTSKTPIDQARQSKTCTGCAGPGEKPVLTPAEAAVLLGRSKSWVVAKLQAGLLPGIRDGSRWIVRRVDLNRDGWLQPSCHGDAPAATGASTGES